ncbi:MAG TPA: protein kinase [Bryobacteraceae bacterium]|jgi:exonuclease VII small subunit|nr:protein kinase [Bryobacteraceae bacterium]
MNELQEQRACHAWPLEEALRFATSLAETLRQMHREGAVCGRLDLRNIVWDNHSAKLAPGDAGEPAAYLAPEQIRGETADSRSDIFAFGAVLYETIAGRRAFPAHDPEELRAQILNSTPPPIAGIPDGIASLLRGCLEKNRDLRWQRMNPVLIELKLAHAAARQAQSATEWREKVVSLRSHVTDHDQRLAAQQEFQDSLAAEFRQAIQKVENTQAAIHESISGLQKGTQLQGKAIEGLQVAASQTDEVVEHVVEAFGMMHKSIVEHGDAKVLLGSRNGN